MADKQLLVLFWEETGVNGYLAIRDLYWPWPTVWVCASLNGYRIQTNIGLHDNDNEHKYQMAVHNYISERERDRGGHQLRRKVDKNVGYL